MNHTIKIPIGDRSGDGHGIHEDFYYKSNKHVDDLYDIHEESKKIMNIEEICSDYEEYSIPEVYVKKLVELGFCKNNEYHEDDLLHANHPEMFADIWVFLLMLTDPELKMEKTNDDSQTLGGYREGKKYISFVGYGLFG